MEGTSNGELNERSLASTSISFIKIHIFPLSGCDIRGFTGKRRLNTAGGWGMHP